MGSPKTGLKILLQLWLAIIAAFVAFGLYMKWNMWVAIIIYWVVLAIKNVVECL